MKKVGTLILLYSLWLLSGMTRLSAEAQPFSIGLLPSFSFPIPIDQHEDIFSFGAGAEIAGEYRLPFAPLFFVRAGLDYHFSQLVVSESISLLAASAGFGTQYPVLPWLYVRGSVSGGYYYGFLNTTGRSGGDFYAGFSPGVSFQLWPRFGLALGATYRMYMNFSQSIDVVLGMSYAIGGPAGQALFHSTPPNARPRTLESTPQDLPDDGKGIELQGFTLVDVFPIFQTYYDSHSIGNMTLKNVESTKATNVKVSFLIRQFMDVPKECATLQELPPGGSKDVDLYALFKSDILSITEKTKVAAEITVTYMRDGVSHTLNKAETIRLFDRNAMTWDDNRKAAAFVTAKDPAVLAFSNNINSLTRGKMNRAVDRKLQSAIAIHDALRLQGISYVSNPLASYADVSQNIQAVDTLKFPRETFRYKAGDCSDLSILYCALLESMQIETAFITIPGHIFMAFALDTASTEARATFSHPEELIFKNEKVWVPVEVTEREKTFLDAWQAGAKEWRENVAKNQVDFYPIREAWKIFESVQLPGTSEPVAINNPTAVVNDFQADVTRFVQLEIYARVAELQAAITKSKQSAKSVNRLGVLYARFDMIKLAETQFQSILKKDEYVPALVNLGNLCYLQTDYEKALSYYQRAAKKAPHDSQVLLGMARTSQELEDYRTAKKSYEELKNVSPELAQQFAYLDLKGEEATRAADISGAKEMMVWNEE